MIRVNAIKRPIEIEAVKWDGSDEVYELVREWSGNREVKVTNEQLFVVTLEGTMAANKDEDWIIKGISGEVYPCKNSIFRKTYKIL